MAPAKLLIDSPHPRQLPSASIRSSPSLLYGSTPGIYLLTIITEFDASLAELFDEFHLTHSKEDSHEDERNNQNWSNKHPQEKHEVMPTE